MKAISTPFFVAGAALVLAGCSSRPDQAVQQPDPFWVSPSMSPEAHATLESLVSLPRLLHKSAPQKPQTKEDWREQRARVEKRTLAFIEPLVSKLAPQVQEETLGGVPVLRVEAKNGATKAGILVYVHGGGFTFLSARSSLDGAALMAERTGRVVYSVDYTQAPDADWEGITGQVVSVYKTLLEQGFDSGQIGFFGDSAGGGIAAGSLLRIRDDGLPLPAALLVQSACADLTAQGETFRTLRAWDPAAAMQDVDILDRGAQYAAEEDRGLGYVSPVFGDYSKGYPPTLVQAGTREFLLSDSVRLYQAIAGQGGEAVLDVYEGMPHVFQALLPDTPESERAYDVAAHFFDRTMGAQ